MPQVTLRQIAEKVGCSRSTVSYALNGNPNISETMRERVLSAAQSLGWSPDENLTRQMALVRKTVLKNDLPNLAVLINKSEAALETELAPAAHLKGAIRHGQQCGYFMEVFNLAENPIAPEKLKVVLRERGIQGVIFIATLVPEMPKGYFEIGREFACSVAGIRYPGVAFHVSVSDFLADLHLCYQKLVERGFKRPGVILPAGMDETLSHSYTGGLTAGSMILPPENRLPFCYVGDLTYIPESCFEQVRSYIKSNQPDVILTTDHESIGKMYKKYARQFKERLPIFTLDWFPEDDVVGGMYAQQDQVGVAAVDLVIGQIYRGEKGVPEIQRSMNIEGLWVDETNLDTIRKRIAAS